MPRTPRKPGIRRTIFNTLTAVSVLLMLVTAGLWVRSYSNSDYVNYTFGHDDGVKYSAHFVGLVSFDGSASLVVGYFEPFGKTEWDSVLTSWRETHSDGFNYLTQDADILQWGAEPTLGFYFDNRATPFPSTGHMTELTVPFWLCLIGLMILPAIWLLKWNKRRKLGPNACLGCGYDLTGNESGQCPECGIKSETPSDLA